MDSAYTSCDVVVPNKYVCDVKLTQQYSETLCSKDKTGHGNYGYDQGGMWVDKGCRGEFEVALCGKLLLLIYFFFIFIYY